MITGAGVVAKKHNISDLAIGLTIVAFGTSAPELVVNSVAAFHQHSDIILGNVIGSNSFNLFVILGIVGLIYPIKVQSSTVWREIPISLVAIILAFVLANNFLGGQYAIISRFDGILLLGMFFLFLFYIYKGMKKEEAPAIEQKQHMSNLKIWIYIGLGLVGLIAGGQLVVDNAVKVATDLGISQKVIGLTIIAAGTSLPELVTSVVAALKKNTDMAIGNIIGSNIFNIFLILSTSAIINPITFNKTFNVDMYLLAGGTLFLFIAMFTGQRKKLDRWEAALLLLAYVTYTTFMLM
jgi:cation:H+ antiporter